MDIQLQNIANKGRKIFLFCRKDNGAQEIIEDNTFFPYWFEPDEKGTFVGYDNTKLRKVFASNPSEISKLRSKQSYSSDILFTKRYIIDKVDKIDISPIKYLFLDIEIQATDLPDTHEAKYPISCITIYNSLYKKIQTWWLPDFPSEKVMLIDFVKYIQEERPDILLAWNMKFDYDYLFHRIKDFAKDISPIHQTRYGEEDGVFYPAGISIVDYLILFRKVYMREPSYALDNIAQKYLQEKTFQKVDYSKLDLNIKEKNINDIRRMVKLEQKFELLSYYNEIRILCLSPDTWITCEGGNIKKLEDIQIGEKIIGTRLDSYKSFKPQIVLNKKEVYIESYKINTNSQFIISSKKHKFLIFKNDIDKIHYTRFKWEEVQNLKSGDVLIQWINYKKQPTNFRDDWFYLMGFYYGDGSSTGKGSKLSISDKDIKNLKIIEKICNKFNIKTTIKKSKYQNSYILEFYNSEFGYLKNKYIPINLPIEYQLSFIAGIFDAEGCVNSKNSLTISQKEPKLIYWISSILFSLGLPNRVFKKNYQYYLVVYDLMNFNRIIHIKSPKKLKKLYNYIKTKRVREYFDTLPIVFLLKKLMIYGKLSRGSGWRKNRKYFSSFKDMEIFHKNLKCSKVIQQAWIKNKNISRNKAWEYFKEIQEKTFLKSYSFKKLSKQIEFILTHVFCAKITSIKKNKTKEKLIDIEVTNENFIANNFASHNSK